MNEVAEHILARAGGLLSGERCVIVSDETTRDLIPSFFDCGKRLGAEMELATISVMERHGMEPPADVAEAMARADLIVALTKMSLAHTKARLAATGGKSRHLSLPGYSAEMMRNPCLLIDYQAQFGLTRYIADAFTRGSTVRVKTSAGTDITLNIDGRVGNCCPGFVNNEYRLGSPPDVEANVSPREAYSNGVIVVDGAITCDGIGRVRYPVILNVDAGRLTVIKSESAEYVRIAKDLFESVGDEKAYTLAECGVGLNPKAEITGHMLTDEAAFGCVHFGFGSNAMVGGLNDVSFHVDFVTRNGSVWIDDEPVLIEGNPTKNRAYETNEKI
jgi:leucyl aminopeptidase (aminopeptidase T)